MALINNAVLEDFLLYLRKLKMMLEAAGTLATNVKLHYICTLLHGQALQQFQTFCVQVKNTTTAHLNLIILGSCKYFCL